MSHPFGNITLETLNKGQETIDQLEKKKKKQFVGKVYVKVTSDLVMSTNSPEEGVG